MLRWYPALSLLDALPAAPILQAAEIPPAMAARIDSVFAEWASDETPGCAIGIMRSDELVFARGYGMAITSRATATMAPRFVRFPDQRFATVILANGGLIYQAESLAPKVVDIVLAEEIARLRVPEEAAPAAQDTAAPDRSNQTS